MEREKPFLLSMGSFDREVQLHSEEMGRKWPGETVQNYCPKALAVELALGTSKASRVETIVQGRRFRSEKLIVWYFAVVDDLCKVYIYEYV